MSPSIRDVHKYTVTIGNSSVSVREWRSSGTLGKGSDCSPTGIAAQRSQHSDDLMDVLELMKRTLIFAVISVALLQVAPSASADEKAKEAPFEKRYCKLNIQEKNATLMETLDGGPKEAKPSLMDVDPNAKDVQRGGDPHQEGVSCGKITCPTCNLPALATDR